MEHKNPDNKTLKGLLQEAKDNGLQLIIVDDRSIDGHHLRRAIIASDLVMVVGMGTLPTEDQVKLESGTINFPKPEPFVFKNYHIDMPEVHLVLGENKRAPMSKGDVKQMNRNIRTQFKAYQIKK